MPTLSKQTPIYLDYAATTPVDPRVATVMSQHLTAQGVFGNPSSLHTFGYRAREAVESARDRVAQLINASPDEVVWTSGATEANNLALTGIFHNGGSKPGHLVTTALEHKSILAVCKALATTGVRVTYLRPDSTGVVTANQIESALKEDTTLVSLAHVNNEIGVIQDIADIGRLTRERGILLHVDAAQSIAKVAIDVQAFNADLLSLSAHKGYGPKGIGALYVRRDTRLRLAPMILGGGQETGLRAGTLAVHQIAGMGEAFRLAQIETPEDSRRLVELRRRLWDGLCQIDGFFFNGNEDRTVAGILNLGFRGTSSEDLMLDLESVAVSSGSACASGDQQPSHVLRAMGMSDESIDCSLRFSLGRFTTTAQVDRTIALVTEAVHRSRKQYSESYEPRS